MSMIPWWGRAALAMAGLVVLVPIGGALLAVVAPTGLALLGVVALCEALTRWAGAA